MSKNLVRTGAAHDRVVAGSPTKKIVARATLDRIVAVVTFDVRPDGSKITEHIVARPGVEPDFLDAQYIVSKYGNLVEDQQVIAGEAHLDDIVICRTFNRESFRRRIV